MKTRYLDLGMKGDGLSSKQTKKLIFKRRGSPVVIDLIAFQFFPLLLESLVNLILGWPKTAGVSSICDL